jgi:hypothetical protein
MFPRLEPAQAGVALAPWAMPVAASPTPVVTQNISPDASALTAPSAAVTPPKATPSQAASLPKATPARTQAEILAEYNKQKAELEDLEIRMELPYWFLEFYDGKMTLEGSILHTARTTYLYHCPGGLIRFLFTSE